MDTYYSDDLVTIYHGDCFEILHDLEGIGSIITDPPYSSGGQYRSDRMQKTSVKYVSSDTAAYRPEFAGDNRDSHGFLAWATLWLNAAYRAANDDARLVIFSDWRQLPTMTDAVQAAGWLWQGINVWHKSTARPRPNGFQADSEFAVWASRGPMGQQDNSSAIYLPGVHKAAPPKDRQHMTQKPESVMRWLVQIAPESGPVLDPFMGSGTTLRAAMDLGRKAIGIEVDERYCEIAAKRLGQLVLPL
jgi:site-specific DNA-methyltransferase (adenine-specific)